MFGLAYEPLHRGRHVLLQGALDTAAPTPGITVQQHAQAVGIALEELTHQALVIKAALRQLRGQQGEKLARALPTEDQAVADDAVGTEPGAQGQRVIVIRQRHPEDGREAAPKTEILDRNDAPGPDLAVSGDIQGQTQTFQGAAALL